jgi:hypothetical protein
MSDPEHVVGGFLHVLDLGELQLVVFLLVGSDGGRSLVHYYPATRVVACLVLQGDVGCGCARCLILAGTTGATLLKELTWLSYFRFGGAVDGRGGVLGSGVRMLGLEVRRHTLDEIIFTRDVTVRLKEVTRVVRWHQDRPNGRMLRKERVQLLSLWLFHRRPIL